MGDEISITVIATGFDASRKRELHARVATGAELRPNRENRDFVRELEQQRQATAIPVRSHQPAVDPGLAAAASAARPAAAPADGVRRGPQNEVEDLDIPAFLRRNR